MYTADYIENLTDDQFNQLAEKHTNLKGYTKEAISRALSWGYNLLDIIAPSNITFDYQIVVLDIRDDSDFMLTYEHEEDKEDYMTDPQDFVYFKEGSL